MPVVCDEVNWADPCERANALRCAYYALISGTQAYEITYEANSVKRSVRYSVIDTKLLLNDLRNAEAECAALQGLPPPAERRRYPMQLGSRRSAVGPEWPEGSE